MADLLLIKEKFAVAPQLVAIVRTKAIFCHIHIFDPHFAIIDEAKRIYEAGFSEANTFNFRPRQYDAGRQSVNYEIIVLRTLVFDVDTRRLQLIILCHGWLQNCLNVRLHKPLSAPYMTLRLR